MEKQSALNLCSIVHLNSLMSRISETIIRCSFNKSINLLLICRSFKKVLLFISLNYSTNPGYIKGLCSTDIMYKVTFHDKNQRQNFKRSKIYKVYFNTCFNCKYPNC